VDFFLGSGSTLIAAQSLERRCFGIEIEPKYVDGIVRRYIAFVGKDNVSAEIKSKYLTEESK
jgi:DNA modification methylase